MTDTNLPHDSSDLLLSRRQRLLLSTLAGALLPLSMAPLDWWPLALACPLALSLLLFQQSRRDILQLGFAFGLGLFAVGASWVYVSIHDFGNASVPLALLLTAIFVLLLALIFCLPLGLLPSARQAPPGAFLLAFAGLWVLGEWLRSWLFTGFPWLLLGYSQLHTPLAGWAPIAGIFAVTLATVATAASIAWLLLARRGWHLRLLPLGLAALVWGTGAVLQSADWTRADGPRLQVALVQPNIPQEKKWQPEFLQPSLQRLQSLSAEGWQADWLIWPEAAIPMLYHRARPFLQEMHVRAASSNTALITGILYDDPQRRVYYNSLVGLGLASGIYHKTRLVPFGEYVPMEHWLRGLIDFFNLPMSTIRAGSGEQHGLQVGSNLLASAICYEIVYPDLVASSSRNRAAIITVSNDAWFGHSWGPLQHLQMARFRALETGRYVLRATNNGVSAIIAPDGRLEARSEQFVSTVVLGSVQPQLGDTPFMQLGSLPAIAAATLMLLAGLAISTRASGQLKVTERIRQRFLSR